MAKKTVFTVHFSGQRGETEAPEALQKDDPDTWQRWLRHARDNKSTTVVTCQCLPAEEGETKRRLKVHRSQTTDQCWLSSYAFTGQEHAPGCRFYSVWPDERQAEIYAADVVKAAADGTLIVRLPTGLQKKEATASESPESKTTDAPGKRRRQPSMRLLGLLHLLWEQSGINVWHPAFDKKKRNSGWLGWRLNQTAARIRIGRTPLPDALLMMARKDTPQVKDNWQRVRSAEKKDRRLILVSVLATRTEAAEERLSTTLPLGLFSGFPDLHLPDDVLTRLTRSYGRELGDWRRGEKVIVIAETEPPVTTFTREGGRNVPSTHCRIIDAALMTVSPRYIPLDSAYEGKVEEKLWQEKRAFIKPLRYDGEENVFPDFVLTDIRGTDALPMEVFGMNTDEYLLRKKTKTEHYDREYGPDGWWQWDAARDPAGKNMPAFPEK